MTTPSEAPPSAETVTAFADPRPIDVRMASVRAFLSLGAFRPASVQRSFRWGTVEALQLLRDLETVFREVDVELDETDTASDVADEDAAPEDDVGDGEAATDATDDIESAGAEAAASAPGAEDAPTLEAQEIREETLLEETPRETDAASPLGALFLGSVVIVTAGDAIEIYDGLQRTTTLTVLLAILRDLEEDPDRAATLHHLIALPGPDAGDAPANATAPAANQETSQKTNQETNQEPHQAPNQEFRLRFAERDDTLERTVQTTGSTLSRAQGSRRPIGQALRRVKQALRDALKPWPPERRRRFAAFVLDRAVMSVVDVADPRLARQIFVSTNLYGKRLEPIETLKGQIIDAARTDDEEALVAQLWTEASQVVGAGFETFLRAVDMIERCEAQKPQWPTDLGDHVRAHHGRDRIAIWMRRLRRQAYGWASVQHFLNAGGETSIEQDIWRLHVLEWDEWRALTLFFWNKYYIERERYRAKHLSRAAFARRERWYSGFFARFNRRCLALALAGLSDLDRRRIFAKAMARARRGEDPTLRGRESLFPTDRQRDNIDRTLRSQIKDHRIWSPLVRWLEIGEWRPELPGLMERGTVEHILPRRPDKDSDSRGVVENIDAYDTLCYSLGNLAILDRDANTQIGNCDYAEKRPVLIEQSERYHTLRSVVDAERWGAPEITARAEALRLETWRRIGLRPPS